jgi:hypothetical protein
LGDSHKCGVILEASSAEKYATASIGTYGSRKTVLGEAWTGWVNVKELDGMRIGGNDGESPIRGEKGDGGTEIPRDNTGEDVEDAGECVEENGTELCRV